MVAKKENAGNGFYNTPGCNNNNIAIYFWQMIFSAEPLERQERYRHLMREDSKIHF